MSPAVRRVLLAWHRWFGLLASVWLLLLAVTGIVIAYYDEIDTALNPGLRTTTAVVADGELPAIDAALANARAAVPGFATRQLQLPSRPDGTLWLIGRGDLGDGPAGVQVFAEPATGRIVGWRESGRFAFDRRYFIDIVYALHVDLALGPWMTAVFGWISLFWLLDHLPAAWLSFPRLARWREAFAVAGRRGSGRRRFDLHRAPGLWAWPLTFVLALTGVTLAWPEASREAVGVVSPVSHRLDFDFPRRAPVAAPIDAATAIARALPSPGARVHGIRLLEEKGVYAVRTFDARDVDDQGRLWTYVDMADGRIVGRRHDVGESAGDVFFAWQYALHSGKAFGFAGRTIVALGGVATAWIVCTGLWLWWCRRRPPRAPLPSADADPGGR